MTDLSNPSTQTVRASEVRQHLGAGQPEVDLLCGARQVGAFIGWTSRQVRRADQLRTLPTFRIGHRIAASRSGLTKWLAERSAAAAADLGRDG